MGTRSSSSRGTAFVAATALTAGILFGGFAHWLLAPRTNEQRADCAQAPAQASPPDRARAQGQHDHRAVPRPYLTRPDGLFIATDEQAEQRYREQQSNELIDLWFEVHFASLEVIVADADRP